VYIIFTKQSQLQFVSDNQAQHRVRAAGSPIVITVTPAHVNIMTRYISKGEDTKLVRYV